MYVLSIKSSAVWENTRESFILTNLHIDKSTKSLLAFATKILPFDELTLGTGHLAITFRGKKPLSPKHASRSTDLMMMMMMMMMIPGYMDHYGSTDLDVFSDEATGHGSKYANELRLTKITVFYLLLYKSDSNPFSLREIFHLCSWIPQAIMFSFEETTSFHHKSQNKI